MTKTIAAGLFALALLTSCSRSEPEDVPTTTNSVEDVSAPVEEPTPVPAPAEAMPRAETVAPAAPPRAAEIAPDEQMQDDADATGMTARVQRDGETPDETTANDDAEPQ